MKQSKRPLIGIMAGNFHKDYCRRVVYELCHELESYDIDIKLYMGLSTEHFINTYKIKDNGFDYHYQSLFGYSHYDEPDLLIISYGTITADPSREAQKAFLKKLPDVPYIFLENNTGLSDCIEINIDNYSGMYELVNHLIREHGYRHITFLSGPADVKDAAIRLQAFRQVMQEHDLTVEPGQIVYSDFSEDSDEKVKQLLAANPDTEAIVCANDDMAISAYRVLRKQGKVVGRDIAVTGFDDISLAHCMEPPLTSIRQDYKGLAVAAIRQALSILNGKNAYSKVLSAKPVFRMSCGCSPASGTFLEGQIAEEHHNMMDSYRRMQKLEMDNLMNTLTLRNILVEPMQMQLFFNTLGEQLAELKTVRSYIALLPQPVKLENKNCMNLYDELCLCLYQEHENIQAWNTENAGHYYYGDFRQKFSHSEHSTVMAAFLLFYGQYHYGIFCVELEPEQFLFYFTLSLEIGTGLRYLYLALAEQDTLRTLAEKNEYLDYTATHDGLTDLYNRIGIMNRFDALAHGQNASCYFAAVMADLDHLKQINDTFGHGEGDFAIKKAAKILFEALPEGASAGRSGGDEFICVFAIHESSDISCFSQRVRTLCDNFNAKGQKPYYINISLGCYEFSPIQLQDIDIILKRADNLLYEAKKERRKNVIRCL